MPSSVCPCTLLELHVGSPGQQHTGAISAHVMALTHKPSFGRSVSQKWATDELCVIIFFVLLFVDFDELSVQTDNPTVARFYTGKFVR